MDAAHAAAEVAAAAAATAATANIVSTITAAVIQVVVIVAGLVTLWVKLKYKTDSDTASVSGKVDAVDLKAVVAANRANQAKETAATTSAKIDTALTKIDENTTITVKVKEQTNGAAEARDQQIAVINERLAKLEDYNHRRSHDFLGEFDAIRKMLRVVLVRLGLEQLEGAPAAQETREAPSPLTPPKGTKP